MPAGRPTTYDPKYCDEAIDFLAQGFSVTAFAGSISVSRSTVYKWAEEHPEFSDALKTGQAKSALWWEMTHRQVATTGEGNASATIFGLKNRAADDWRDKRDHDHTSSDGTMRPQVIEIVAAKNPDTATE